MEKYIFNMVGPRDLTMAKLVCKDWNIAIKSYIENLDPERTSDLMTGAFCEPVRFYLMLDLSHQVRDLTTRRYTSLWTTKSYNLTLPTSK